MPPSRRSFRSARAFVPHIYSLSELKKLLPAIGLRRPPQSDEFSGLTFRMILLFLYGTGARINETLSLKIQDVDVKQKTVTFHQSDRRRTRTIPIGVSLYQALLGYSRSLDTGESARAHFFVREDGNEIRPISLSLSFKTLRRQRGFHDRLKSRLRLGFRI
jgi:integrase/recombinase XerD